MLYCTGAYFRAFSEKEVFSVYLAGSSYVRCRTLSFVYYRRIFHWKRRYSGSDLCCTFFIPYSGDRLLFTESGWGKAVLSGIPALIFEKPEMCAVLTAWQPILYAGVMSCGVAYTLQIIGQKNMNPTVASLILSLESCISVLAGWVILGQKLSARELLGCALVFAAVICVQLPDKKKTKQVETA